MTYLSRLPQDPWRQITHLMVKCGKQNPDSPPPQEVRDRPLHSPDWVGVALVSIASPENWRDGHGKGCFLFNQQQRLETRLGPSSLLLGTFALLLDGSCLSYVQTSFVYHKKTMFLQDTHKHTHTQVSPPRCSCCCYSIYYWCNEAPKALKSCNCWVNELSSDDWEPNNWSFLCLVPEAEHLCAKDKSVGTTASTAKGMSSSSSSSSSLSPSRTALSSILLLLLLCSVSSMSTAPPPS